jgi:hypothetical protein
MLQDKRLCGVTFLVGSGKEEKIIAHRFILASRSSVFFTMFCGSFPETNKTVDVPYIEPAIFISFILSLVYQHKAVMCNLFPKYDDVHKCKELKLKKSNLVMTSLK